MMVLTLSIFVRQNIEVRDHSRDRDQKIKLYRDRKKINGTRTK
jgi:hypothetical protein